MNIGDERSLGVENGVEMFSTVISHNELHGRFVRLSDNKEVFSSRTVGEKTYIEYFDPDFWTIALNGQIVDSVPNIQGNAKVAATLGDRVIRISTK
jgi:hypothetical protein